MTSNGAYTLFITEDRHIVIFSRKARSKWWTMVCCSASKRHFRRDGSCKHVDNAMAAVKPEIRPRVRIEAFGTKGSAPKEAA